MKLHGFLLKMSFILKWETYRSSQIWNVTTAFCQIAADDADHNPTSSSLVLGFLLSKVKCHSGRSFSLHCCRKLSKKQMTPAASGCSQVIACERQKRSIPQQRCAAAIYLAAVWWTGWVIRGEMCCKIFHCFIWCLVQVELKSPRTCLILTQDRSGALGWHQWSDCNFSSICDSYGIL